MNATSPARTLIDEGEAFRRMGDLGAPERHQVIVIGGGQAGLSVGYHLKQRGVSFVILEAAERVGEVWRKRWDSLRLFTPARFDSLDGLPFPGPGDAFPTKDQMADYLESYAAHFQLPVRCGVRVERVWREGERYLVRAGGRVLSAAQVVIALGSYQGRKVPAFAKELSPQIVQLHSSEYQNLDQLRPGPVLLVGAGNSGAEIAMETAPRHPTWLAGRDPGEVPFRISTWFAKNVLMRIVFRLVFHRLLTVKTPFGRKARIKMLTQGGPRIRQKSADLEAAGIRRTPRVAGAKDGLPLLDDGSTLDVANVIWCTGFSLGLSFLDLPIFGPDGEPRHHSGVVQDEPGLYFVGQHFQHSMSSGMIHGVGRDAAQIAAVVSRRLATAPALAAEVRQRRTA